MGEPGFKITKVWAFIATEADGTEGIPAVSLPHPTTGDMTMFPMVCADMARVNNFRPMAEMMCVEYGCTMELREFTTMTTVETIG